MGVFQCDVFQNNIFQGPCGGVVVEQPREQPREQPAGRVYAPVRKRKPERLVFLEREILEKRRREQELKQRAQEAQARAEKATAETQASVQAEVSFLNNEIRQLQAAIAGLIREIQLQIERDEDDAIAAILMVATLH